MPDFSFSKKQQARRRRARDLRERALLPFLAARGFDRPLSRAEVQALFALTFRTAFERGRARTSHG